MLTAPTTAPADAPTTQGPTTARRWWAATVCGLDGGLVAVLVWLAVLVALVWLAAHGPELGQRYAQGVA